MPWSRGEASWCLLGENMRCGELPSLRGCKRIKGSGMGIKHILLLTERTNPCRGVLRARGERGDLMAGNVSDMAFLFGDL